MKPVLIYVDDEPRNLTVLEANLGDLYEIHTFDNPLMALEKLEEIKPWVILSDQRMPGITGVQFLVLSKKLFPESIRIIVTGYSDEDLVIDSVRKANIFDYIKKPWEVEDLESAMSRAIDFYKMRKEKEDLINQIKKSEVELTVKNLELTKMNSELKTIQQKLVDYKKELESWVPPFVLWAINDGNIQFPIKKNLIGITFDIINSSNLHHIDIKVGHSLRSALINKFSELVMNYGGWRESHSGDSCYAHFGLMELSQSPFESAMSVAREFRAALRSIAQTYNVPVECGIALHYAKDCMVSVHNVMVNTPHGSISQKSFDTTSSDVDILHRMEKLTHKLPGSNIIVSQEFFNQLAHKPMKYIELGEILFKGQKEAISLMIIPSDQIDEGKIEYFMNVLKTA